MGRDWGDPLNKCAVRIARVPRCCAVRGAAPYPPAACPPAHPPTRPPLLTHRRPPRTGWPTHEPHWSARRPCMTGWREGRRTTRVGGSLCGWEALFCRAWKGGQRFQWVSGAAVPFLPLHRLNLRSPLRAADVRLASSNCPPGDKYEVDFLMKPRQQEELDTTGLAVASETGGQTTARQACCRRVHLQDPHVHRGLMLHKPHS